MKRAIFATTSSIRNRFNEDQEKGWREAIAEASNAFDTFILCPWSYEEDPGAWERPDMVKFVDVIRANGMELGCGRGWWSRKRDEQLGSLAPGDPLHHLRALVALEKEGRAWNAEFTWADIEPQDKMDDGRRFFTDPSTGWKSKGLPPADRMRVESAIARALAYASPATFVEPGSSADRPAGNEHYSAAFRQLGINAACRGTYKARTPEDFLVPDPDAVTCCGSWVSINPTASDFVGNYGEGVLSCEEYMEHIVGQEPAWKAFLPNLGLWWVYTLAEEKRDVMLRLGELAAN